MMGATLLFGLNYWVAKDLMPDPLMPMQVIFIRVAGAFLLFSILRLTIKNGKAESIAKRDIPRLIFAGISGIALNQTLFFKGLNLTSPLDTSIINSTNPLMVLLLSSVLLPARIRLFQVAGIVLGIAGTLILLMSTWGLSNIGSGSVEGNMLILGNTFFWSLYLIISKPLFPKYHPYVIMQWLFFVGFIATIPFTISTLGDLSFSGFSISDYLSIIYIVVGTTFLAYLFISFGLAKLSSAGVAVYTYLQPVIVTIIGIAFYGESPGLMKIVAMLMVLAGIYLVNREKKPASLY